MPCVGVSVVMSPLAATCQLVFNLCATLCCHTSKFLNAQIRGSRAYRTSINTDLYIVKFLYFSFYCLLTPNYRFLKVLIAKKIREKLGEI
jgi:hypothetical protein